jgi:hypothetical protein
MAMAVGHHSVTPEGFCVSYPWRTIWPFSAHNYNPADHTYHRARNGRNAFPTYSTNALEQRHRILESSPRSSMKRSISATGLHFSQHILPLKGRPDVCCRAEASAQLLETERRRRRCAGPGIGPELLVLRAIWKPSQEVGPGSHRKGRGDGRCHT